MARKFDRSKPHGTIYHAEASDGRMYEQDGAFFDAAGNEWTAPEPLPQAAAVGPDPGSEVFKAAVAAAVAEALKAAGVGKK